MYKVCVSIMILWTTCSIDINAKPQTATSSSQSLESHLPSLMCYKRKYFLTLSFPLHTPPRSHPSSEPNHEYYYYWRKPATLGNLLLCVKEHTQQRL